MKYKAVLTPSLSAKGFGHVDILKIYHGKEIFIGRAKWNGYQIFDFESIHGEGFPKRVLVELDEQCAEQAKRKEPNEKYRYDT